MMSLSQTYRGKYIIDIIVAVLVGGLRNPLTTFALPFVPQESKHRRLPALFPSFHVFRLVTGS